MYTPQTLQVQAHEKHMTASIADMNEDKRPAAYLKIYTPNESDRQHSLVVLSQVLLGHAQSHVGLLGSRHIGCCLLAGCFEGVVLYFKEHRSSVSLYYHTLSQYTAACVRYKVEIRCCALIYSHQQ